MKKTILLAFLCLVTLISATSADFSNQSVATTDNFLSGLVNPAALAFNDNFSLTYMQRYIKDDFEDDYAIFYKQHGFEYIFEDVEEGTYQTFASGNNFGQSSVLRNLYLGYAWNWRSGSFKEGNLKTSMLYRPANFLSLGYVLEHPNDSKPQHRLGLALRPITSGSFADGIELSVDAGMGNDTEDKERGFEMPTVGLKFNLMNALSIGGTYNTELEEIGLNFSLTNFKLSTGGFFNIYDDESSERNEEIEDGGYAYVTINEKLFSKHNLFTTKKFLDLGIGSAIVDENSKMNIGPITIKLDKNTRMLPLLDKIKQATNDKEIGGIIFTNNNFGASFAKRQELLTALHEFKNAGKYLVFYYENISNANYAFAANIADAIYLNPEGMVSLSGLGGAQPYVKDLLDKLGVDFYNFRSHPYKTAGNMFSESEMTEQERLVLERLYGDIYEEMVKMIHDGRAHKLSADVKTIINNGPYFDPQDALDNGLVDQLVEWHELNDVLVKNFDISTKTKSLGEYVETNWHKPGQSNIAVIYASGNIISGKGQPGKSIGSETTAKAIRDARNNPMIDGIILRVDSGGGSALASHIIAEEVRLCTEGPNKKPIIALMSGVAASGGYYISTHADEIIAEPTTITGSIGVIGMMPNFARVSRKVGVNWSEFKFGDNATFGSVTREMTPAEKEMFKNFIHSSYKRFVSTVANSRDMSYEETNKIAMGQVWTGNQALKNGLVDKLGGFEVAIADMKNMLGTNNEMNLIEMGVKNNSMFEVELDSSSSPLFSVFSNPILKKLISLEKQVSELSEETILYKTPYDFTEETK